MDLIEYEKKYLGILNKVNFIDIFIKNSKTDL